MEAVAWPAKDLRQGPLEHVRVLALGGRGPVPHACTMLADLGAQVVRIERPSGGATGLRESPDVLRGQQVIELDLATEPGRESARGLALPADVVMEGWRPGVAERLGLGPLELRLAAPHLIYARMTGWGQTGPWSHLAGHDLNYIAVTGVLGRLGPPGGPPTVPLNLVGDYGAGSMFLVAGTLAALLRRAHDGEGQEIDVAMVDGVLALDHASWVNREDPLWSGPRGTNLLDGGAPFYTTYETSDARFMAVAALEPTHFVRLLGSLDADPALVDRQLEREAWPEIRAALADAFAGRSLAEWSATFLEVDACVTPVLSMEEAAHHEHLRARCSFLDVAGLAQHAPAPRFARTPAVVAAAPHVVEPAESWSRSVAARRTLRLL